MTAIVVVPALHRDALEPCLRTMHPDMAEQLLIVDNSVDGVGDGWPGTVYRPEPHAHQRDYQPRCNIGVARTMNVAARAVLGGAADAVVWVSTSMRFGEDGGRRLLDAGLESEFGVIGLPAALHAFALKRGAFEAAGLWDENFWPGYWEDHEWLIRCDLVGVHLPLVEVGGTWRDGHGYDTLRSLNPGRQVVNFAAQEAYVVAKWGGTRGEVRFAHPFDDASLPIDWWEPVTREELVDRYELGL